MTDDTTDDRPDASPPDHALVSRADLEAVAAGELDPDDVFADDAPASDGPTRRGVLSALGLFGTGAALAGGSALALADVGSAQQGGLFTSADPGSAYLSSIQGPVADRGSPSGAPITQLVNVRVEEQGASISPSDATLVIRYDPNS